MEFFSKLFFICLCWIRCRSLELTKFISANTMTSTNCSDGIALFAQQNMNMLSCGRLCASNHNCSFMIYEADHDGLCTGCQDIADGASSASNRLFIPAPTGVEVFRRVLTCDSGWVQFQDTCYWLGDINMSFAQSAQACEQMDSRLVHIDTEQENNFLLNTFKALNDSAVNAPFCAYIGATDDIEEGTWRYYDTNATISFDDFQAPEPNGLAGEHCAAFVMMLTYWADLRCDFACIPQCEKAL